MNLTLLLLSGSITSQAKGVFIKTNLSGTYSSLLKTYFLGF